MLSKKDPRTRQAIAAYGPVAQEYREQVRLRRPVADVRRFAAFARRDDLVLDVGCGPANDLRVLRDAGLHPVRLAAFHRLAAALEGVPDDTLEAANGLVEEPHAERG